MMTMINYNDDYGEIHDDVYHNDDDDDGQNLTNLFLLEHLWSLSDKPNAPSLSQLHINCLTW